VVWPPTYDAALHPPTHDAHATRRVAGNICILAHVDHGKTT
jgi:hypothetical protein